MHRHVGNRGKQKAQQQHESRRLRADGEKRRRRRRRALINVRHPDLERERGDLEAEPGQNKQHAEQKQFVVRKLPATCASSLKLNLPVVPHTSAMPYTMNADDSAPRIRYFTPASSDATLPRVKLVST